MKTILILLTLLPRLATAQDQDFFLDQEYEVSPSGTIDLTCDDAEVRITGSERTTARVIVKRVITEGAMKGNRKFDLEVIEKAGNLVIREKQSNGVSISYGSYEEDYTITIEAPGNVNLRVQSDDGNVTVQRIGGAITLRSDDGDLQLQDCPSEAFDLEADDGDIAINQGQGTLNVRIDDGDLNVQQGNFSAVDVATDDGDIALTTSLTDDGRYQLKASDGKVDLRITQGGGEFDIHHDDSEVDTSGQFTLVKTDDDYTQLTLPQGSAQVEIQVDDGHVALHAL